MRDDFQFPRNFPIRIITCAICSYRNDWKRRIRIERPLRGNEDERVMHFASGGRLPMRVGDIEQASNGR